MTTFFKVSTWPRLLLWKMMRLGLGLAHRPVFRFEEHVHACGTRMRSASHAYFDYMGGTAFIVSFVTVESHAFRLLVTKACAGRIFVFAIRSNNHQYR